MIFTQNRSSISINKFEDKNGEISLRKEWNTQKDEEYLTYKRMKIDLSNE